MEGISQILTFPGNKGVSVQVTVTETYDALANTSNLTLAAAVISETYGGHIYYLNGSLAVDHQALVSMSAFLGTHSVYVQTRNAPYPIRGGGNHTGSPWTLEKILHNTDGSKTVTVSVNMDGQEASGKGADGWKVTGSQQVKLTHIPRASGIGATDAAIGSVSVLAVNKKSAAYTHCIAYAFGELAGYITPEGNVTEEAVVFSNASVAFRVPESFYGQIPAAKSGSCTLTCHTYCEGVAVGEPQSCSFLCTADETLCAPEVSGAACDVNPATLALTGDENVLVRFHSNVYCAIASKSKNGAAIASERIGTEECRERVYEQTDAGAFLFTAVDTRGYATSVTVEKTVIPYVQLSCNPVARRVDPTSGNAKLSVSGNYFSGSFGAAENFLSIRFRVGSGQWQTLTPVLQENRYTAEADLSGLEYTQTHSITIEAEDALTKVLCTATVGKGIPVFDWGEGDVSFHVPVNFNGQPVMGFPDKLTVNGVTEWLRPPMESGVEYRTTERFRGKPVYTKLVELGTLPGVNSRISAPTGVTASAIIRLSVVCSDGSTVPYAYSSPLIHVGATPSIINVCTVNNPYADYSDRTGTAQIWYIK